MPTCSAARILRSDVALRAYPDRVTDDLVRWARETPDATFLAERDGERWRTISFAAMLERARRIGAALLAMGGSPERPLAIAAENGIEHAAVALGAMYAGIPASPISTGYVRADADPARLRGGDARAAAVRRVRAGSRERGAVRRERSPDIPRHLRRARARRGSGSPPIARTPRSDPTRSRRSSSRPDRPGRRKA